MNGNVTRKMASLASRDPFYLGWHLVSYAEMTDMSMTKVGMELGGLPDTVDSISLCRAPRAEPHFREDVEAVADRFQVRADKLARILRYVQVSSDSDVLLAARDRSIEKAPGIYREE